jgi:hypothetical protein
MNKDLCRIRDWRFDNHLLNASLWFLVVTKWSQKSLTSVVRHYWVRNLFQSSPKLLITG